MENLFFWVSLLVGFFLSEVCNRSSFAFPQNAFLQRPQLLLSQSSVSTVHEQQKESEQVNTVRVICHSDSLEIRIEADMFAVGAPVKGEDLHLGVDDHKFCSPSASVGTEYRIVVGLMDCGTKHWMTEDSLVYTNLLVYSPMTSPHGILWLDEAVIPIECHYERKYSLSSSSLMPTWIPFISTQAAVESLEFDLRLMTSDWQFERSNNVFYLSEPINIEASVRVRNHMDLRVFVSSCVATLNPDMYSHPSYIFIENGCLVDSKLAGSKAHFVPRRNDNKLHLVIDAFRFHSDDRGEVYITCHLNALPVNDAAALNKACTFENGRWRSADGNDFLCGYCQNQNEHDQIFSEPRSSEPFGFRGFGKPVKPKPLWRSELKANLVWEQDARVGPVLVLPLQKSGRIPVEELPAILHKLGRPVLYGSQWRSGINDVEKGLPDLLSSKLDLKETTDGRSGHNVEDAGKPSVPQKVAPEFTVEAALDNVTAGNDEGSPTLQFKVTTLGNATATETGPYSNDPKK
ncbi:zona pellucida sperm-binding protein 3-like [Mugil cephalus]|uniref:zona pellucida sperm-binding protein 3-like n=1 Tax=Mugil cephalus TaxID=48193 RepID=UPI001FB7D772|nr:zona pellucida sperm-binding protein 3-like [Mugil cephalus]